jgi:hypothetical protein
MPYDRANQSKDDKGQLRPKWPWLLANFGGRSAFDRFGSGFQRIAELIRKTNPRHQWNLSVMIDD